MRIEEILRYQEDKAKKCWEYIQRLECKVNYPWLINILTSQPKDIYPFLILSCAATIISARSLKRCVGLIAIFSFSGYLSCTSNITHKTAWMVNIAMLRIFFRSHFYDRALLAAVGGVVAGNDFFNNGRNGQKHELFERLELKPQMDSLWNSCADKTALDTNRQYRVLLDTTLVVSLVSTLIFLKSRSLIALISFSANCLSNKGENAHDPNNFNYKLINLTSSIAIVALLSSVLKRKGTLITACLAMKIGELTGEYIQERKSTVSVSREAILEMARNGEWEKLYDAVYRDKFSYPIKK